MVFTFIIAIPALRGEITHYDCKLLNFKIITGTFFNFDAKTKPKTQNIIT